MYKVNASLASQSHEIGRARAFTPGWLENESIWLHMEYKYLLEVLKAGLYEEFFRMARQRHCSCVRATAAAHNQASYAFHTAVGMMPTGTDEIDGVPVVPDYFGPGKPRVVFEKTL